jgi:hypothetical protein
VVGGVGNSTWLESRETSARRSLVGVSVRFEFSADPWTLLPLLLVICSVDIFSLDCNLSPRMNSSDSASTLDLLL